MNEFIIIYVALILFISSLCRSALGFGDALIAMPMLSLFISVKIAAPVVAIIASIIAISIIAKNWKMIEVKDAPALVIFSLIGIPFGLFFLKDSGEGLIKILLGVVLIIFAAFKLFRPEFFKLATGRSAPLFALIAGVLGGAYNTNGPPIIIYGTLRSWEPEKFRAILQGIFLPTNLLITIGHGWVGLWNTEMLAYLMYSLPLVLLAMFLGSRLNKKINPEKFHKYIYIILGIIGISLIGFVVL